MEWRKALINIGVTLKEYAIAAIEKHCEEEVRLGEERQKERDIYAATRAFVELKQSDGEIFGLLHDYFEVEDISQARRWIKQARVSRQIINLRIYCTDRGMSNGQFIQYATDHKLEEKLTTNPKLLELSAEKLRIAIEKIA